MKFSIYSLPRSWTFNLANSLLKSNNLDYLITSYPKFFTKKYGIPDRFVKSFIIFYILNRLSNKLTNLLTNFKLYLGHKVILERIVDWITDYIYSLFISKNSDFLLLGFGNSSNRIIKKAKAKGNKTIYFVSTLGISFMEKQLKEEYAKLGLPKLFEQQKTSSLLRKAMDESIKMADYVGAVSSYCKKTYVEEGVDESKIFVCYAGVDTKVFFPKYVKKDKFIVLCVAHQFILKGIRYLIDAYNSLELNNSELWILGSGNRKYAERFVNVKKNNIFLKSIDEFKLPDIYNQCRIFCIPTLSDGMPGVLLQAMACGLPAICTKYSIAPDLITEGQEGFIVEPSDTKTISNKIKFFYDNPDITSIMGKKARKRIEENFTWDHVSERIVNFCNQRSDQSKF